jgi:dTDP-4-amino-4,6-dideoxygalactose transaminase
VTSEGKKIKLTEPVVGQEELQIIRKVLESGWLAEGPMTREFEAKLAQFTGAKYAIATTSCTTALELALRALHIKRGDEVIVPDFTYPATADAVSWVGANPVLVDVDISSYNINMNEVEKAINKKTRCLMPVSWGGNPLNIKALNELKEEYGLYIIEDAACSLGSEFAGKKTGTMADVTCFSFQARKVITTGEGGMITTDDEKLAEEIKSLKKFGMKPTSNGVEFVKIGTNYKLCDILGAIGVKQMERIDVIIDRRIELASNYTKLLESIDFMKPPIKDEKAKHTYQTYAVYIEIEGIRDKIIQELKKENIETQIGTYALHLQKAFKNAKRSGDLATAEKLYENLLALPMCHSMTLADQEYVINEIARLIEKGR